MRTSVQVSITVLALLALACGSSDPESSTGTHTLAAGSGDEAAVGSEPAAAQEPEQGVASHRPGTRWPETPTEETRFHLILHPIDVNADNVEPDALEDIDQFFIDHIHAEAPEVFVAPPGSSVPEGLLGYALEPAVEAIDDQPGRCRAEVQLILMTHEDDLRADIPAAASAIEGEGHHRQRHAVQGAFTGGLRLLRQALEAAARRDAI